MTLQSTGSDSTVAKCNLLYYYATPIRAAFSSRTIGKICSFFVSLKNGSHSLAIRQPGIDGFKRCLKQPAADSQPFCSYVVIIYTQREKLRVCIKIRCLISCITHKEI